MQLSRISKALAVIGLSSALSACSLLGIQTAELGYNYATDKPGHRDIVQVYDLNGHTVIQFRDTAFAKVTDERGHPIPYKSFGTSYELDRVYSRFTVTTGRTTINIRRQAPQHERMIQESLKQPLLADTDEAAFSHEKARSHAQARPVQDNPHDEAPDAEIATAETEYAARSLDDASELKRQMADLSSEIKALKAQLWERTANEESEPAAETPAVEPKYEAYRHYWRTELPDGFMPDKKLAASIEKAFATATEIRVITYRDNESDDATDAAGLRGELVKQYFLDIGVPKDAISTNILKTDAKGKAAKKVLRMAEIRFIH